MEIIIGRSKSQKLLFFTNPENIIRNTETLIPLPGIIISVQGRGVVPPRSEKEDVNIIVSNLLFLHFFHLVVCLLPI